jgi:hypothetical protein
MSKIQRALAGLTLCTFTGVIIPGPALAGGYRNTFNGDRYGTERRVQEVEYDPGASRSRYSSEQQDEEEARQARSSQGMKALGALVVLGLLLGAMSGGSSESYEADNSDDGYGQRQIERASQAQEEARQERLSEEARQQQQNCYGGCAW